MKNKIIPLKVLVDIIEAAIVLLLIILSVYITSIFTDLAIIPWQGITFTAFAFISWFVLSRITSMVKLPRTQKYKTILIRYAKATLFLLAILTVIKYVLFLGTIKLMFIIIYVSLFFIVTSTYRIMVFKILKGFRIHGRNLHNVLIVAEYFSEGFIDKIINHKEWGFKICGIISDSKRIKWKYGDEYRIIPENHNIKKILDTQVIDEIIYSKNKLDVIYINKLSEICNETGIIFRLQSVVSMFGPNNFQLKTINSDKMSGLIDTPSNSLSLLIKTIGDIYLSLISIILLFPLFSIIGLIIKLDNRGPIFFKQERIGVRGRKFYIYKFRTMRVGAEKELKELQDQNEASGPVFKIKEDPRITRVGKFLRKTGLDELPQLYNVVKGDMSLIGPRPPLASEVEQYERWQLKRLSVKPGITCTWQIVPNRHEVSFEKWMKMDIQYINNWKFNHDISLFFKTLTTFFVAGGH